MNGLAEVSAKSTTKKHDVVVDNTGQIWGRGETSNEWFLANDDGYYEWDDMSHPVFLLSRMENRKRTLQIGGLTQDDVAEALASVVATMQKVPQNA